MKKICSLILIVLVFSLTGCIKRDNMEDITILKDAPFNMYGSIVELYGSSGNDFYVIKEIINDINKNAGINTKV